MTCTKPEYGGRGGPYNHQGLPQGKAGKGACKLVLETWTHTEPHSVTLG